MNSDVAYDLEAHKNWLADCFNKKNYYHWIIQCHGNDVGLLNFVDWDQDQKTTSWGFYIGDENFLGLGGMVPPYFYNFAFDVLGVETITADVFYNNLNVIKLHLMHGYHFVPAQDHVIKKGKHEILMVRMALEQKTFKSSRFCRYKADFPLTQWQSAPF